MNQSFTRALVLAGLLSFAGAEAGAAGGPIVRDHRGSGPIVRDHRGAGPIVRDHRSPGNGGFHPSPYKPPMGVKPQPVGIKVGIIKPPVLGIKVGIIKPPIKVGIVKPPILGIKVGIIKPPVLGIKVGIIKPPIKVGVIIGIKVGIIKPPVKVGVIIGIPFPPKHPPIIGIIIPHPPYYPGHWPRWPHCPRRPGGGYYPIVVGEPYPVMVPVAQGVTVYNLQCALPEGSEAQGLSAVNVDLMAMSDGNYQVFGNFMDGQKKEDTLNTVARGTLSNELSLSLDGSDEILLQAKMDEQGTQYLQGKVTLKGNSDQDGLACTLSVVKQQ